VGMIVRAVDVSELFVGVEIVRAVEVDALNATSEIASIEVFEFVLGRGSVVVVEISIASKLVVEVVVTKGEIAAVLKL